MMMIFLYYHEGELNTLLTCIFCFSLFLQDFDDFIFAFFAIEMVIKMVALGIFGKKCYLGDTWNRLDFFIVVAGWVSYAICALKHMLTNTLAAKHNHA